MADPTAAAEHVDEKVVPGADSELSLDPHQGRLIPPEGDEKPKPDADKDKAKDGDPPSPVEDKDVKPAPADGLAKKVGELAFENRQLKRQLDARSEPGQEQKPEPIKTLKDFDYDEAEFNEYLVEETSTRTAAKMLQSGTETSQKTAVQKADDEFASRETAFDAEHPGYSERLHAKDLMISHEMAAFIRDPDLDDELGHHVGDYLSQNKAEAAKISSMSATAQARAMTKLETKIGKQVAKANAEKKKPSNAPPPPTGLDGLDPGLKASPSDPSTADSMSDADWLTARNKQLVK